MSASPSVSSKSKSLIHSETSYLAEGNEESTPLTDRVQEAQQSVSLVPAISQAPDIKDRRIAAIPRNEIPAQEKPKIVVMEADDLEMLIDTNAEAIELSHFRILDFNSKSMQNIERGEYNQRRYTLHELSGDRLVSVFNRGNSALCLNLYHLTPSVGLKKHVELLMISHEYPPLSFQLVALPNEDHFFVIACSYKHEEHGEYAFNVFHVNISLSSEIEVKEIYHSRERSAWGSPVIFQDMLFILVGDGKSRSFMRLPITDQAQIKKSQAFDQFIEGGIIFLRAVDGTICFRAYVDGKGYILHKYDPDRDVVEPIQADFPNGDEDKGIVELIDGKAILRDRISFHPRYPVHRAKQRLNEVGIKSTASMQDLVVFKSGILIGSHFLPKIERQFTFGEIRNILQAVLKSRKGVQRLDLSHVDMHYAIDGLLDLLRAYPQVTQLVLQETGIDQKEAEKIVDFCEKTGCIKELTLRQAWLSLPIRQRARYLSSDNQTLEKSEAQVKVPEDFLCPITGQIMLDPVVLADGESYEATAIEEWLKTHDTSPLHNENLEHKTLTKNRRLQRTIEDFLKQHPSLYRQDNPSGHSVYVGAIVVKALQLMQNRQLEELQRFVENYRLLFIHPVQEEKTLLQLACEQPSTLALEAVLKGLDKALLPLLIKGINPLFRLAAQHMGPDGAKLIADAAVWEKLDYEAEALEAIKLENIYSLKACLFNGVLINAPLIGHKGDRLLHQAVKMDKQVVVEFLIQQEADIYQKNETGQKAAKIAYALGAHHLVKAIKDTYLRKLIQQSDRQIFEKMTAQEHEIAKLKQQIEQLKDGLK